MPVWLCWVIAVPLLLAAVVAALCLAIHFYYRTKYLDQVIRIFEEKPLFIVPRGLPEATAEDVSFRAVDGALLRGCYLRHRSTRRRGVILFGLEFGSNRWAAGPYCEQLRASGYDVFAYEPRNQGESEVDPNYQPLQWITDRDVADARAAYAYLEGRYDADPRGVGIFGISKGGSIGFMLAAENPAVRCVVTDGAFATYTTVVPYMRRWVSIYSNHKRLQAYAPDFLYGSIGLVAMHRVEEKRKVRFPWVETAVRKVKVPVLMIHGGADTYIKPEMAETLFAQCASTEKRLLMIPKAKHNQAPHIDPATYHGELVAFFDKHLGSIPEPELGFGEIEPREVLPFPRSVGWEAPTIAAREIAPRPRLVPAGAK